MTKKIDYNAFMEISNITIVGYSLECFVKLNIDTINVSIIVFTKYVHFLYVRYI